jgi:hypothetical protein
MNRSFAGASLAGLLTLLFASTARAESPTLHWAAGAAGGAVFAGNNYVPGRSAGGGGGGLQGELGARWSGVGISWAPTVVVTALTSPDPLYLVRNTVLVDGWPSDHLALGAGVGFDVVALGTPGAGGEVRLAYGPELRAKYVFGDTAEKPRVFLGLTALASLGGDARSVGGLLSIGVGRF